MPATHARGHRRSFLEREATQARGHRPDAARRPAPGLTIEKARGRRLGPPEARRVGALAAEVCAKGEGKGESVSAAHGTVWYSDGTVWAAPAMALFGCVRSDGSDCCPRPKVGPDVPRLGAQTKQSELRGRQEGQWPRPEPRAKRSREERGRGR